MHENSPNFDFTPHCGSLYLNVLVLRIRCRPVIARLSGYLDFLGILIYYGNITAIAVLGLPKNYVYTYLKIFLTKVKTALLMGRIGILGIDTSEIEASAA